MKYIKDVVLLIAFPHTRSFNIPTVRFTEFTSHHWTNKLYRCDSFVAVHLETGYSHFLPSPRESSSQMFVVTRYAR